MRRLSVVAAFGNSSVSTPSAYLACTLAASTSCARLKLREMLP